MQNQDHTIEKILFELSKENLNKDIIVDLFKNSQDHVTQLIEKLSLEVALQFWNGQITYLTGDVIMNKLLNIGYIFNKIHSKEYEFSTIAWECYLAFDAGEYYPKGDDRTLEPSEKYTKSYIEEVLKKNKLIP